MTGQFSEIQPGIRKFAMAVLENEWPEWDKNTLWPSQSQGKFDHSVEPWPGRDMVVVELLRALREAGMINGVFRSDYATPGANPCCRRCGERINVRLIPGGVGGPDRYTMYCRSCGAVWDQFGEEINVR